MSYLSLENGSSGEFGVKVNGIAVPGYRCESLDIVVRNDPGVAGLVTLSDGVER
jgi:hypothetical protein